MHPIMYGVMNGVDDPRLVGKSSGFSSLPASRSDETARGAYASRVIARRNDAETDTSRVERSENVTDACFGCVSGVRWLASDRFRG